MNIITRMEVLLITRYAQLKRRKGMSAKLDRYIHGNHTYIHEYHLKLNGIVSHDHDYGMVG